MEELSYSYNPHSKCRSPQKDGEARGRLREAADEEDGGGRKHGAVEVAVADIVRPPPTALTPARTGPHTRAASRSSSHLASDYNMVRAPHSELAECGIVPARLPPPRAPGSAEPRAVPVDWDRFLPSPGTLHRLVVQPVQLPPAPGKCGCCSGYYRIDDMAMTRFLRETASEAIVLPEEDAPVYVFLPPGP